MKHQSRQENLIYLIVWGLLFAAPLLSLYVRTVNDPTLNFDWTEVFLVWRKFAVFLVLFVIHNVFLAPLIVHQHRRTLYISIVAAVMVGFTIYQCSSRRDFGKPMGHRPPSHIAEGHLPPPLPDKHLPDMPPPIVGEQDIRPNMPPPIVGEQDIRPNMPPPFVGEHDILAIVVLLLMFGANLGTKYYFRSRNDHQKLLKLEKQNLEQQLEYLRYQINPHFFMNTLNNIHALVDIDPAKAQETIVELSKMMRFLLYEGDKNGVPLTRELEFIRTYTNLMQLRYTDNVRIDLDLPAETPDKTIPPLMLIPFIENAFKHGVSYKQESFIEVKIALEDGSLHFSCRNSKADVPNQEKGGVGLANVRKRLNLLYEHNYSLRIKNDADIYSVELSLPLKS